MAGKSSNKHDEVDSEGKSSDEDNTDLDDKRLQSTSWDEDDIHLQSFHMTRTRSLIYEPVEYKSLDEDDIYRSVYVPRSYEELLQDMKGTSSDEDNIDLQNLRPPPGFLPPPGHPMHMNIPPPGFLSNRMPAPPIHDRLGRPSYWRRNTLKRESEDDVFDSDADFGDDELGNEEEGRPSKDRHKVDWEGIFLDEDDEVDSEDVSSDQIDLDHADVLFILQSCYSAYNYLKIIILKLNIQGLRGIP